ncbi:HNH endonuclease [Pseudomonas petrae]|uniref:HNH endonuclease n=1 Tax=Pseudomonas petrae TaxID=2912190 RepID=UPI001EF10A35|nr:HNH endonuclease [Pseudomonas petrae]MCF7532772.1 HNH endonuclease [Pseudomonas petrae]MCF7557144.1 HNH endonuclease [Pseudomonas petrae]
MRLSTPMPNLYELQEIYVIDSNSPSGLSRFKAVIGGNGKVGPVLSLGFDGYWRMKFNRKFYRTHRIIYFMHHGIDPAESVVDHIDGNPLNNRIENLRKCTHQENLRNARKRGKGELPKGVTMGKGGKYQAQISIRDKVHTKVFATLVAATTYLDELRKHFHGEFARN